MSVVESTLEELRARLEKSIPKAARGGTPTKNDWRRHRKMIARKLANAHRAARKAKERENTRAATECGRMSSEFRSMFAALPVVKAVPIQAPVQPADGEVSIYALSDPRDHVVRYVGKTARALSDRVWEHEFKQSNAAVGEWLRGLRAQGVECEAVILERCRRAIWQEREIFWIAEMRKKHKLLNVAKGGRFYGKPTGDCRQKASQGFHRMAIAKSGPVKTLSREEIAKLYG